MSAKPRGLIIAIETYDPKGQVPSKLEGTVRQANEFKNWLLTKKGIAAEDIVECISSDWPAPATTRQAIFDTLAKIITDWQDQVPQLYAFISGHGLSQKQLPWLTADYLLTSDFKNFRDGSKCIPLQEMRMKLWISLGPGDHYYFIDVCRTQTLTRDIELTNLGLTANPSQLGRPAYATLFSARDGAVAAVDSGFGPAVVDGLGGRGRAKCWVGPELAVTFDSLKGYVRRRIAPQEIDPEVKGDSDRVILEIKPPVQSDCTVEVAGAGAGDLFEVSVADDRGRLVKTIHFAGPSHQFQLDPGDYVIGLSAGGAKLDRVEPPAPPDTVDLYDRSVLRFRMPGGGAAVVLGGTKMEEAAPATPVAATAAHQSIRAAIGQPNEELVSFSESMGGAVGSPDLSLWLSLLGASRVIRDPSAFSKLRDLQLATFDDIQPNGSAFYVLTAFEEEEAFVSLQLDGDPPLNVTGVPGLQAIVHGRIDAAPGPHNITLNVAPPLRLRLTAASYALPNRVTVLVVVFGPGSRPFIRQLMLPLYTLTGHLPGPVREYAPSLRTVQFSVMAQTQLTQKRELGNLAVTREDRGFWEMCLYGKWFDPVMSLMAAYDIVRREPSYALDEVVRNLRRYFAGLPDVEAIAALRNQPWKRPNGYPLLLDGALALHDVVPETLPGKTKQVLDYRSPWTTWIGLGKAAAKKRVRRPRVG